MNNTNNFIKNKKNELNKCNKEPGSSLVDNNSYSNVKKNIKKKSGIKLFKDFENKINDKIKKNWQDKKANSIKTKRNIKINSNKLNYYKKVLSNSPSKYVNITNRDLNLINKLPFKDKEEDILFSLYDNNNIIGTSLINNHITKFTNNNNDKSRNKSNEFTLIKKLYNNTSFSSSIDNKSEDKNNNTFFPFTRTVFMNNLIWENIKSSKKYPIQTKMNFNNYNKTMYNFKKNKTINNNKQHNFFDNNLNTKCISSRNQNQLKNVNTEENRAYFKTYNIEKNTSFSKDDSYTNNPLEKGSNVCLLSSPSNTKSSYLTTFRNSKQTIKNTENRVSENNKPPLLDLK